MAKDPTRFHLFSAHSRQSFVYSTPTKRQQEEKEKKEEEKGRVGLARGDQVDLSH